MKTLVTYYSQTGNTEKIARAIYDALHGEKELIPIEEVKDTQGYGIIFIGFPVQAHSVPAKVLPFFKRLPEGQRIAFFCTHGSLRGGHLPKQALEHAFGLASKAKIMGTFGTRGKVSSHVLEALTGKAEHRAWSEEAQGAHRHPDEADLADAQEFARGIMAKVGQ